MELWSRRKFFLTSLAGSAAAGASNLFGRTPAQAGGSNGASAAAPAGQGKRPLIISSANGGKALGRGVEILKKGAEARGPGVPAGKNRQGGAYGGCGGCRGRPDQASA